MAVDLPPEHKFAISCFVNSRRSVTQYAHSMTSESKVPEVPGRNPLEIPLPTHLL